MKLPLINEAGKAELVKAGEVLIVRAVRNGHELVTGKGVFHFPHNFEELCELLGNYGFERVDRNAMINMAQASEFDPELRTVHFAAPDGGGGDRLYSTVSKSNADKLKHLIRESADWGGDRYQAIAPAVSHVRMPGEASGNLAVQTSSQASGYTAVQPGGVSRYPAVRMPGDTSGCPAAYRYPSAAAVKRQAAG